MMQTDVKSARATADATMFAGRARLKGVYLVPAAAAGTAVFKDGGSGGTTLLTLDTIASATGTPVYVQVPGEGILFSTDIYLDVTNVAMVTIFYG